MNTGGWAVVTVQNQQMEAYSVRSATKKHDHMRWDGKPDTKPSRCVWKETLYDDNICCCFVCFLNEGSWSCNLGCIITFCDSMTVQHRETSQNIFSSPALQSIIVTFISFKQNITSGPKTSQHVGGGACNKTSTMTKINVRGTKWHEVNPKTLKKKKANMTGWTMNEYSTLCFPSCANEKAKKMLNTALLRDGGSVQSKYRFTL